MNIDLYNELLVLNKEDAKKFTFENLITYGKVYKCYDGDTVSIIFKFNGEYLRKTCRINGIDTPEISRCSEEEKILGKEARDYLISIILNRVVEIEFIDTDKYGRPLIKIFLIDENKTNINDLLIQKGYAQSYYGGPKNQWI